MKKFLSLLTVLAVTTQLQAADVDLATAQSAAKSFMTRQVAAGRLRAAATANLKLAKAEASIANPKAVDYYIFNSDKSYVVVSGDDQAPEILMYGEEGAIDMNNIPPGMQWLLNKYKYQIDGIKAGTLKAVAPPKTATTAVEPLVKANWDQTAPYYNQTPTSNGRHTYTGCPATSLSMCFYLYKWPKTYPALPAIPKTSYGVAAAALQEKAADWDNIIDEYTGPTNYSYTSAQADAVAWLMRYVGQACTMEYSTSGSGADDPEILEACHTFGYTDAKLLTLTELVQSGWSYTNGTQKYTDAQWNEWMLEELHAGRPIEYLAYDITSGQVSGHAFNVFGCNTSGQYYVNWGWSGDSNGYCTLHNFTTSTGATGQSGSYTFKYGEAMIIGIAPPSTAQQLTAPTLNAATSISTNSFTASWTYNPETTVTYTLNVTTTGGTQVANVTGITDKSYNVTGLNPATTYVMKVKAVPTDTENYTESEWSATRNVTTTEEIVPTITVTPTSIDFGTLMVGETATKTFTVTGANLEGNIALALSDPNDVYSLSTTMVTKSQATSGRTITVTYNPKENKAYDATVTLTSANAQTVTVSLTGAAAFDVPVMTTADENFIKHTSFRADWTDNTPAANVASYTLEVNVVKDEPEPTVELLNTLDATGYSGYNSITLPAPWGGSNVRSGYGSIYFSNSSWYGYGYITYTIPEGYENATFTLEITSASGSYGQGNFTVATPQTASTGHEFKSSETFAWVVTASSGEQIKITSTDSSYSPDIVMLKVYRGDATAMQRKAANETGDENYRTITGITDKSYIVNELLAGGTFTYRVKALYTNGTESNWSNVETVTLNAEEDPTDTLLGDVNNDGNVDVDDVNALIAIILGKEQADAYGTRAYITDDDTIDVDDVNAVIAIILGK